MDGVGWVQKGQSSFSRVVSSDQIAHSLPQGSVTAITSRRSQLERLAN
jgi:hypothetical protein